MKFLDYKYNKIDDFENLIKFKATRDINIDFFDSSKVVSNQNFENKLINTVTAFANNIGGIVVLGIGAVRKKAKNITYIKNKDISKVYLENLLSYNIKPIINNINIIEFSSEQGNLFVIKIPKSKIAPHISNDYRYYTRQNDKTVLMHENIIRNLFTVNNKPELEFVGVINTNGVPSSLSDGKIERINFFPKFLIKNTGSQIERFYKVEISIPSELHDVSFSVLQDYFTRFDEGMTVFSISGKSPIFQNEIYTIADAKLTLTQEYYHIFETGFIEIKLFFSKGTKTTIIDLKNTFLYNRRLVELEHFISLKELNEQKKGSIQ